MRGLKIDWQWARWGGGLGEGWQPETTAPPEAAESRLMECRTVLGSKHAGIGREGERERGLRSASVL